MMQIPNLYELNTLTQSSNSRGAISPMGIPAPTTQVPSINHLHFQMISEIILP